MPASQLRNFVFTLNNYAEPIAFPALSDPRVRYLVYGKETAPGTGTPHLQGYVELDRRITFSVARELVPGAHIESRRGSAQQAADYCKKDGDFHEQGTITAPGTRTDLKAACALVTGGGSLRRVCEDHPETFVRYHRGLAALRLHLAAKRNTVPTVNVLYGLTGTGKSRTAREMTTDPYVWGPELGHWWDGYDMHTDVIMEEFRGQLPFGLLLRLLDRYDCQVQVKGGSMQFMATNIVITSPIHPRDWYTQLSDQDKYDQLARRITRITHMVTL